MVENRAFSAINANYVVVKITAPEEDLLAQEVEVKNGAGVVVPVKPLDIAAGDETAEFEFVTAVKADDLKGVWTVNGKEYDLDLFNNLKAFLEAKDQLALNKALTDLGIENVKVENMPEYFEAKGELNVTAEELTLADVQKLVDDVNAKAVDSEEEEVIVKAVVDAKKAGNQVALLQALQNDVFVRVNPEWIAVATNGYMAKITEDVTTIEAIQTVINESNDAILNTAGTLTTTGIDKDKLTKSKALIESWATVDKDGKITDGTIKTYPAKIDIQLALADVVEATTPTALKNKVVALNELLEKDAKIDMDEYVDANGKAYIAQIAEGEVDEVDELRTAISDVNKEVNGRINLEAVTVSVANVEEYKDKGRLLGYSVTFDLAEGNSVEDTESIVIELLDDKDNILGYQSLNAKGYQKIKDGSSKVGTIDVYGEYKATSWDHAWNGKMTDIPTKVVVRMKFKADGAVAEVEKAIDQSIQTVAKTAIEGVLADDLVKVVKESEDVAEVEETLVALANLESLANFLATPKADRTFVAETILEEEAATKEAWTVDTLDTYIGTLNTDTIEAAKTAVNALNNTSNEDAVIEALENVTVFNKLTPIAKKDVANAFIEEVLEGLEEDATPNFKSYTELSNFVEGLIK